MHLLAVACLSCLFACRAHLLYLLAVRVPACGTRLHCSPAMPTCRASEEPTHCAVSNCRVYLLVALTCGAWLLCLCACLLLAVPRCLCACLPVVLCLLTASECYPIAAVARCTCLLWYLPWCLPAVPACRAPACSTCLWCLSVVPAYNGVYLSVVRACCPCSSVEHIVPVCGAHLEHLPVVPAFGVYLDIAAACAACAACGGMACL